MEAKLLGEKSGGMTAVEIYDGGRCVWSNEYFTGGCTQRGYIDGLCSVYDDMVNCGRYDEYEPGNGDGKIGDGEYDTIGVICSFDSETNTWKMGRDDLGQSTEIAAALMLAGKLSADDDILEVWGEDAVTIAVAEHIRVN